MVCEKKKELKNLGDIIAGTDRDLLILSLACIEKAKIMVENGHVTMSEECILRGCAMAHVADIHRSRGDITTSEYKQLTDGLENCNTVECPYNPDYDVMHRPVESKIDGLRDVHYIPRPMSG